MVASVGLFTKHDQEPVVGKVTILMALGRLCFMQAISSKLSDSLACCSILRMSCRLGKTRHMIRVDERLLTK